MSTVLLVLVTVAELAAGAALWLIAYRHLRRIELSETSSGPLPPSDHGTDLTTP